jgi:hypothetical protein
MTGSRCTSWLKCLCPQLQQYRGLQLETRWGTELVLERLWQGCLLLLWRTYLPSCGVWPVLLLLAAGQRERMLAATERMQKTSDRLHMGKQQLAETEVRELRGVACIQMGTQIMTSEAGITCYKPALPF